ncbi:hypothetical protein LAV60_15330 [Clostridium sporogenes]|uniref:hypothetical protein n=1 Tax=Clostridium sporogenes TaxID=1509 RepID=UPI0022371D0A|nr:hypothetical protein [Clostridium sporogenes]MCW6094542.1 hypothetical protein [Clostridium sporogenes]
MALIKEKITDYGVPANYWKIGMVSIDRVARNGSCSLHLYIQKGAKAFIESRAVFFEEDKFDNYFGTDILKYKDIYTACYAYVKDNDEYFADAVTDETGEDY